MLIVVNAIFSMFSFCKLLYLYMFRCGAREAVRGVSCFPADCGRCHRCRSGCFLFSRRLRRFAQMPFGALLVSRRLRRCRCRSGASCFPHRLRRWRQGVSVSFVTMLHVTCYNKVVPYCAGWALRNYIVYILYI